MNYEVIIGLEVHAELSTKSKIYCTCTTGFGGMENTRCCPVCMGMPGTLPVLNKRVVEYAVKAGLAMNCEISEYSRQDRKNYFYPDLPKAYQISQYDLPLCTNGHVDIETGGSSKRISITRIHIEEDAGKLLHDAKETYSLIDYNRCGVPLIEIVSGPDMRSAEEAKLFLENVKAILQYTGVSDCKMQEGSLRVDVNLSVKPFGRTEFGTRTEMKNLNSFRAVTRAIEWEAARQMAELAAGRAIIPETRRWDDLRGVGCAMRNKEEAQDYRYFPDPDLAPVIVDRAWLESIKASIPELPGARKQRYVKDYGLPEHDASVLTSSKALSDFFEGAIGRSGDKAIGRGMNTKAVSNWIMGSLIRILRERDMEMEDIPFPPEYLSRLVAMIDTGLINGTMAKTVFDKMFDSGKDPRIIVEEEGLQVLSDEEALAGIVKSVLEENPGPASDYMGGKDKAMGFLIGQAMRKSKGSADPQLLARLLKKALGR